MYSNNGVEETLVDDRLGVDLSAVRKQLLLGVDMLDDLLLLDRSRSVQCDLVAVFSKMLKGYGISRMFSGIPCHLTGHRCSSTA